MARRVQVTFNILEPLLPHVDALADREKRSRSNALEVLVTEALEARGVQVASDARGGGR